MLPILSFMIFIINSNVIVLLNSQKIFMFIISFYVIFFIIIILPVLQCYYWFIEIDLKLKNFRRNIKFIEKAFNTSKESTFLIVETLFVAVVSNLLH